MITSNYLLNDYLTTPNHIHLSILFNQSAEKGSEWFSIVSIFIAALLAFHFNLRLQNRIDENNTKKEDIKKKELEEKELNAAIVALTDNITRLLSFKQQNGIHYKEAEQEYKTFSESLFTLNSETSSILINFWRRKDILRKFIPKNHFNFYLFTDNLDFIANYEPKFLLPLHRIASTLIEVNEYIDHYNNELTNYRRSNQTKVQPFERSDSDITYLFHTCDLLINCINHINTKVDEALWFIQYSVNCLEDYSETKNHELNVKMFKNYVDGYKDLMPKKDLLKGFKDMIEKI